MLKDFSAASLIRHAIIIAIVGGIFALDLVTPLGMAVPLLYLFPILLTNWVCGRREALYFTAVCTALGILGYFLSPPGGSYRIALFNRTVGLAALWALAVFMTGQRRAVQEKAAALVLQRQAEAGRDAAVEARAHADVATLGAMAGQQRLEKELTARELQLAGIIRSAMDAIITVDEAQRVVLFNEAAEKMFRRAAADAMGRPIDQFIPERFRAAHGEHVKTFGRSGATSRKMGALGTITGLRSDGEEFPAEAAISQVATDGGKYFTVVLRDITERKQMEEALKESEGRFKAFMDHSPAVAWIKDEEGRYVYASEPLARLLGKSADDILGRTDTEFWPPEMARQFQANDAKVLASGEPLETTEVSPGSHGDTRHWMVLKFPIEDHSGRRYVGGVAMEVTERRRLEAQLRQTERLAEMGTLASGMAHEIGTPMNVILGRAEQLIRRTQEEATRKSLEVIVAQVERITKIMNQLLTFARRKPSERRRVNLGQTLDDCLEVLQERLRRTHVRVESRYETLLHPVHVHADPDQMSQVFLNLFINAIHAMPDGGTLRISLEQADSHVKAVIADTGHGISKEDLPRIFHPFFTTKEVGKGTGLGLTVVYNIVQEHGGSIAVDSEPGKGTTFTITLPAGKD